MEIRDIEKLAQLSRIELTDAEKQTFATDLENILHYVDQIREVTTTTNAKTSASSISSDDTVALGEVGDIYNILREDEVTTGHEGGAFSQKILDQAPATQDGFVKVKKILG